MRSRARASAYSTSSSALRPKTRKSAPIVRRAVDEMKAHRRDGGRRDGAGPRRAVGRVQPAVAGAQVLSGRLLEEPARSSRHVGRGTAGVWPHASRCRDSSTSRTRIRTTTSTATTTRAGSRRATRSARQSSRSWTTTGSTPSSIRRRGGSRRRSEATRSAATPGSRRRRGSRRSRAGRLHTWRLSRRHRAAGPAVRRADADRARVRLSSRRPNRRVRPSTTPPLGAKTSAGRSGRDVRPTPEPEACASKLTATGAQSVPPSDVPFSAAARFNFNEPDASAWLRGCTVRRVVGSDRGRLSPSPGQPAERRRRPRPGEVCPRRRSPAASRCSRQKPPISKQASSISPRSARRIRVRAREQTSCLPTLP